MESLEGDMGHCRQDGRLERSEGFSEEPQIYRLENQAHEDVSADDGDQRLEGI